MSIRTFVAIPIDKEITQQLVEVQQALSASGARVRWVAGENIHLTMKFLGDVRDEQINDVCEAAKQVAKKIEPFEFTVAGVMCIPPRGALRMIWVGLTDKTGTSEKLQSLLEDTYAQMGFRKENRSFRPHLTLGRVKSSKNTDQLRQAVEKFANKEFGLQLADQIIVFSSQLKPDGPVYSPMATIKLGNK